MPPGSERKRISSGGSIKREDKKETITSTGEGTHTGLAAAAAKLKASKPMTAREKQIAENKRKAEKLRLKREAAKKAKEAKENGTDGTNDGDTNKNPVNGYSANPNYRMRKGSS